MRIRVLLFAVLLALGGILAAQVEFDTALDRLVPSDGGTRKALLALRSFPAADLLVFLVDGADHPELLGPTVAALSQDLAALPGVRRVDAGFDLAQGASIGERLAAHAAAFVPEAALQARTRPEGIRAALLLQRARLEGPAGAFLEGRILRDPLDLETLAIEATTAGLTSGVTLRNGRLTSRDGRYAMVMLYPEPQPGGGVGERLTAEIRALVDRQPLPVDWYGGPRFAEAAATGIRRDVSFAGVASTVILVLVLVLGFRSWRPLVGTLPAVAVAGVGAALGAWLTSPIHPIQLGFSGALGGIAADYWLHLYLGVSARPGQVDRETRYAAAHQEIAELWPTLLLNAGATSVAFGVLGVSDVPALRVLGLTGALSALSAFVATVGFGPLVWALVGRPATPVEARTPTRWAPWLVVALLGVVGFRAFDAPMSTDPMALLPRGPEIERAARTLWTSFGISEARGLVLLEDSDPHRLLDRSARVEDALRGTGLAEPVGPGSILPGPGVRAARRAVLPPVEVLQADLDRIAEEVGFQPFPGVAAHIYASVDAQVPLDLWVGTPLQERVSAQWSQDDAGYRVLVTTPLVDPVAEPFLADTVAAVDAEAAWIVPSLLARQSIAETSQSLLVAAVVGAMGLLVLLTVRYRSVERGLAALAPAVAAVAVASGGLAWVGQPWNLVSVTVMVLVVGLGVDYGIFLSDESGARRAVAARAVTLSAATTLAGFLPLCVATTPVLRSVGFTLLFGIGAATLVAVVLTPRLAEGWPSPRIRGAVARLAFLGLVGVHLDLGLILVTAFTPPDLPPLGPELLARSRMVRSNGLWLLSTTGGPVEAGYAAGVRTAHLRPRLEEEMLTSFETLVPHAAFRWAITRGATLLGSGLQAYLRDEDQLEIAATAAADPDTLWLGGPHYTRKVYYHAIHDLGQALVDTPMLGCTGFLAGPGATADGHWLLGRNFDFEGGVDFDRDKVVRVHRPENGVPYLSIQFAGISGAVTGVNEAGIAVAINAAASDAPPRLGTPMTLIVREILETATSLDEAEGILRSRTGFVSENVMVVDARGGRAALFEVDSEKVVRVDVGQWMAVSNHFRSAPFAADVHNRARMDEGTTVPRLLRMEELLTQQSGRLDSASAAAILSDTSGVGGVPLARGHRWALDGDLATHSVVIDATAGVVWVSRFPNVSGGYARVSLAELFAGDLVAHEVVPADPDAELALVTTRARTLLRRARRGSAADAVGLADEAAALLPGHPEVLFEQGRARAALGDRAGAEPFLRAARAATPEYGDQRRAIDELLR